MTDEVIVEFYELGRKYQCHNDDCVEVIFDASLLIPEWRNKTGKRARLI